MLKRHLKRIIHLFFHIIKIDGNEKEIIMNTNALFQLSYGLYVAASKFDKKMNGCIVNTVMQVTSNPLQIAVAVNKPDL